MFLEVAKGLLIPFLGTSIGAACVFFMKSKINVSIQRAIIGFSAGVMVAASIWSLLIPAMQQAQYMGKLAFVPAAAGFWIGVIFLILLGSIAAHLHQKSSQIKGTENLQSIHISSQNCPERSQNCPFGKNTMFVLAIVLHNIPEGMAVGVVYAGLLSGNAQISIVEALTLSLGIAIQNIPEGAIISMPLKSEGMKKPKAFLYGVLSGIVEPIGAVITIAAANTIEQILPYLLAFAAGAMMYVVVQELIPELTEGKHSNMGAVFFAVGFTVMMSLDVALG